MDLKLHTYKILESLVSSQEEQPYSFFFSRGLCCENNKIAILSGAEGKIFQNNSMACGSEVYDSQLCEMYLCTPVFVDYSSPFVNNCLELTSEKSVMHRSLNVERPPSHTVHFEGALALEITRMTHRKNIEPWSVHRTPWLHASRFFFCQRMTPLKRF